MRDLAMINILVVANEPVVSQQLQELYRQNGYAVIALSSAEESIRRLQEGDIDFVITDIDLPGIDGVQLISHIHQKYPELPVIAITDHAEIQAAVDVLKLGACDFVMKPFDLATVLESTRTALESAKGYTEIRQLRRWLKNHFQFSEMLSQTPQMHRVFELIRLVAPTDLPVLIHGETGTGKELVADAIHHHSERRGGPFVTTKCAGVSEALLERELFGQDKSPLTGVQEAKPGKIAVARGGTLFLDEIESMPLATQEKMLRVLEGRKVQRLGASQSLRVDMRVIAASSASLKEMVSAGTMRSEFYYRINVVPIHLTPLRDRSGDIPLLVQNFLNYHPVARSKRIVSVSDKILARLMRHTWPGNVRELHNVLECAILLAPGRIIEDVKLPEAGADAFPEERQVGSSSLRQWLKEKEKHYLSQKLTDLGGNVGLTAKSCRIGVRTLSRKMRTYGLDKKVFKEKPPADKPSPASNN
jgi:two-component system, NtrC family, response regulator HydG